MKLHKMLLGFVAVVLLAGCSSDPEAKKKRYLGIANEFLERGENRSAAIVFRKALQVDRFYGEAYYGLGIAEMKQGRVRQALLALRRATEIMPEHRDAFHRLAMLYLAAYRANPRRADRALPILNSLFESARPHHEGTYEWNSIRGQILLAQRNYADSVVLLRAAVEEKENPRMSLWLARALAGAGEADEAEQVAKDVIARKPTFGPAYEFLYRRYRREDRFEEAEAIAVSRRDNNPDNWRFAAALATHYWRSQQQDKSFEVLDGLLSDARDRREIYGGVGDLYRRYRELDRAATAYELGIENDPENRILYRKRLAQLSAAQGRTDEAMDEVNDLLAEEDGDAGALALRAQLLARGGELEPAIEDLRAAIVENPKDVRVRLSLGQLYLRQGALDDAAGQLREVLHMRPANVPATYGLAAVLQRQGRFREALILTERVLEENPGHTGARRLMAADYARTGDMARARDELEIVLAQQPKNLAAETEMANLDLRERNFQSAAERYLRVMATRPNDARALGGLVRAYLAQNQVQEAEEVLLARIERTPENIYPRQVLSTVYLRTGRFDGAIDQMEAALELQPENSELLLQMGSAQQSAGNLSEAERCYRKALEASPGLALAHLRLAKLAESRGDRQAAIRHLESVVDASPLSGQSMAHLARLLADGRQNLNRALSLVQRAKQLRPDDPLVDDSLAWVHVQGGRIPDGLPILEQLVQEHPTNALSRFHLGVALDRAGEDARASREFELAFQQDPSLRAHPLARLAAQ